MVKPTDEEVEEVYDYMHFLANNMALKDWTIELGWTSHDDDNYAANHLARVRKSSIIELSPNYWSQSPEDRRHTLTHELLHCHANAFYALVETAREVLGAQVWNVYEKSIDDEMERMVDAISDGISGLYPTQDDWMKLGCPKVWPMVKADISVLNKKKKLASKEGVVDGPVANG